jgi:hypothetical protein
VIYFKTQQDCSIDPIVRVPWLALVVDPKSSNRLNNSDNRRYDDSLRIMEPYRYISESIFSTIDINTCDVFSDTYDIARQKFRTAVLALQPNSYRLVSLPLHVPTTGVVVSTHETNGTLVDEHSYRDSTTHATPTNTDEYTIDIVILPGNCRDEKGIVVHISGTHGIEGFAGSAIQVGFLHGFAQQQQQRQQQQQQQKQQQQKQHITSENHKDTPPTNAGICHSTVVLIHAFNPYGMKHYRRVNEHNVDLNRNGLVTEHDWDQVLHQKHYNTQNYDLLIEKHLLASSTTTSNPMLSWLIQWSGIPYIWLERYILSWTRLTLAFMRFGIPTLKAALVGGQYHVRDGLFYGGGSHTVANPMNQEQIQRNEPSLIIVRDFLDNFLKERRQSRRSLHHKDFDDECVTWIDVHTGLGPMGVDTLLFGKMLNPPDSVHLKHWFPMALVSSSSSTDPSHTDTNRINGDGTNSAADAVQQGFEHAVGYTIDYYYTTLFKNYYTNSHNLFMVQEFGTVPSVLTGRAFIVEHLIHNYYSQNVEDRINTTELLIQMSKEVLGAAFYPQRTAWRSNVLQRGIHALQQAMFRSSHYTHHSPEHSIQDGQSTAPTTDESMSKHPNNIDDSIQKDEL